MESSKTQEKTSQFIHKLLDMMDKFPLFVFWSNRADELVFSNLKYIQQHILPDYFRHNKISSFIRQLNMYGFCKKTQTSQLLKFRHKIFKKGNTNQFSQIKRKSKITPTPNSPLKPQQPQIYKKYNMSNYNLNLNLTQQQTQQLQNILILKDKYQLNLKYLKDDLEQLIMQIEDEHQDEHENDDDDESVQIIDGKLLCVQDDVVRTIREEYLEGVLGRIGECEELRKFVENKLEISANIDQYNSNQPQYQQQLQSPTNTNTNNQHQQISSNIQFQDNSCSIDQKINIDLGCLTHENRDIDIQFQLHLPPLSSKFYNNDEQFSSLY